MPLFQPGAEFSSDVDHQNSGTYKPFSVQGHMSNVRKLGELPEFLMFNSRT
jgi:hypothetical protein